MGETRTGQLQTAQQKIREIFSQFRNCLDELMFPAMHKRVLLYGYESYTGRFIKWYAEYYHSIKIDYLVSPDMTRSRGYDQEIFRPSILDFDYRDVKDAVIWLAEPLTKELQRWLKIKGGVQTIMIFIKPCMAAI